MKKNIKTVLYDSDVELTYSDYHAYLADNDMSESQLSYDDYVSRIIDLEYESFMTNIQDSSYNNCKCIILGSLGRWNGRKQIVPCVEENLSKAIKRCMNVRGFYYIKVEQRNNSILVSISHHDGIDTFEIHLLNKRGEKATMNADLSKPCYHKAIKGYIF